MLEIFLKKRVDGENHNKMDTLRDLTVRKCKDNQISYFFLPKSSPSSVMFVTTTNKNGTSVDDERSSLFWAFE